MADFAKAQLAKYGWTEGKGLGRNENGITTALKPKLKFDTTGIGHKHIDGNDWWETAFNKAANNILVSSDSESVLLSMRDKDRTDLLTEEKMNKDKTKKNSLYGNFLKTSTLCNGNLIPEETANVDATENDRTQDRITIPALTDEQLFKACGGRTAHKGARHGLSLNGKLERIARQEECMLNQFFPGIAQTMCSEGNIKEAVLNTESRTIRKDNVNNDEEPEQIVLPLNTSHVGKSRKAKREHRRKISDMTHQFDLLCKVENDTDSICKLSTKIRKKSKKKRKDSDREIHSEEKQISRKRMKDSSQSCSAHFAESEVIKKKQKKHHTKVKLSIDVSSENLETNSSFATQHSDSEVADAYTKREAQRLNIKVNKKKVAKLRKKNKIKVERITKQFEKVHVELNESFNISHSKKKVSSIVNNMVIEQIAENTTERIKKKSRKHKKIKNDN